MEIRSVMVNVDLGNPASTSLHYAIDLARDFGAELIGVGADQPNMAYLGVDGGGAAIDFYNAERAAIEEQLARAEQAFRAAVPSTIKSQWRGYLAQQVQSLLECASSADIIVTPSSTTTTFGETQKVSLGELVLGAGRPVLNVALPATKQGFDKIVIGWKDTREARRAVSDALPFLTRAKEVAAFTVSEGNASTERESLDNLAAWLAGHGVKLRMDILKNPDHMDDVLQVTALEQKADLLVIGAYGHTRMREWLFGGVTRSVLGSDALNRLLSN